MSADEPVCRSIWWERFKNVISMNNYRTIGGGCHSKNCKNINGRPRKASRETNNVKRKSNIICINVPREKD